MSGIPVGQYIFDKLALFLVLAVYHMFRIVLYVLCCEIIFMDQRKFLPNRSKKQDKANKLLYANVGVVCTITLYG